MEELKTMKNQLMAAAQSQMSNLEHVDAEELGEVIDMIKDIEEAMYYCSIVEAMNDSKEEKKDNQKYDEIMTSLLSRTNNNQKQEQRYYTQPYYPIWEDPRETSPYMRRMSSKVNYYGGNGQNNNGSMNQGGYNNTTRGYDEMNYQTIRDPREGSSGRFRRGYVEGKENHQDKNTQMQSLENYMKELSSDITEMIHDASQEEKVILQQRLNTLASKVMNA